MSVIDNQDQTMLEALKNATQTSDRIDIHVAFFYFSGWKLLANELKDKKIRILVGKYIDPDAIPDLLRRIKQEGEGVDLDPFRPRAKESSRTEAKKAYINGFVRLFNETSLFDDEDSQETYGILEKKIEDGSLEIKKTSDDQHGKLYILHNKKENSHGGDFPGTFFIGSSNFTFNGLLHQGELNDSSREKYKYESWSEKFNNLWNDSENIDVATKENKEEFLNETKRKLWIHQVPKPYSVYLRVLHEVFATEKDLKIKTPSKITNKQYTDLDYQIDAIRFALDKVKKYDGAILADVVGLGKSIIASAVAYNLGIKPIIISPKHLTSQWDDYQSEFRLMGARVYKSTKLEEVYEKHKNTNEPYLIIIDEAHRFRNEDTNDYRLLHDICRMHPENKVLLLTATPFNNNPKDIFALIKLFQTPGESTIRSVDNLSLRFRELVERYKKLNNHRRKHPEDADYIKEEADEISFEMRRLIEPIVIRRSRLDLKKIIRYREDLEIQNYGFSEPIGPGLLSYELGDLEELYHYTLSRIANEDEEKSFKGTRYRPFQKIKDIQEFKKVYGEKFEEADLRTAQANLSKFMRRLLVMRFESSKFAFKSTLENIISSHKTVEKWWSELGKVPIMKKGSIPDPEIIMNTTDDDIDEEVKEDLQEKQLEKLETKGMVAIDKKFIDNEFIKEVREDIALLEEIHKKWYGENSSLEEIDPKIDKIEVEIKRMMSENNERKVVVFTSYADTAKNLYEILVQRGTKKIMFYTGKDTGTAKREEVSANFDAGYPEEKQKNEYDILIATDTLSEGVSLHRAGVVINYDIPYNPTRVVQRIGRINRINKRVFDKIYIYNFFPTATGESEIRIKQISTLKMRLINSIVGSDVKTLTNDEKLQTFFKDQYKEAEEEAEQVSWDAPFLNDYHLISKDEQAMKEALEINSRSRVLRKNTDKNATVVFGKKGEHAVFAVKEAEEDPQIVASEFALPYFKASKEEEGYHPDEEYSKSFRIVRDALFVKHKLPAVKGRRQEAIKVIKTLEKALPGKKDNCRDLERIIKKYDDIDEGSLKDIAKIKIKNPEEAFKELQKIVPDQKIKVINERVNRLEGDYEAIILSEDLR